MLADWLPSRANAVQLISLHSFQLLTVPQEIRTHKTDEKDCNNLSSNCTCLKAIQMLLQGSKESKLKPLETHLHGVLRTPDL